MCTRVKDPDVDDWKKPLRMLRHLKETPELELTLEATDTGNPQKLAALWCADAAVEDRRRQQDD